MGGDNKRLTITSTGVLAVYTLGGGWVEGITSVPPILNVELGGSISGFAVLPDGFETDKTHTLTVEDYFEDGSKTTEVPTFTE